MKKFLYLTILSLTMILGIWGYRNYDDGCYDVCNSPEKYTNFKNLSIEIQFETFGKCNCNYDSVSARYYWADDIGKKGNAIDFLLNKLRNETNDDTLSNTLFILGRVIEQQEIKGRDDIASLVKQTIDKIPDKDERNFISKILGREKASWKERLLKIANEIESRTKMSKEEYQDKVEKEIYENLKKKIESAVTKAKEVQTNQANSK